MKVHNKDNLPLIKLEEIKVVQGELKDLTEVNYNKLKLRNEHLGLNGLKLRMKFEMLKTAMSLESRKSPPGSG